jgi:hypothetical protein
MKNEKREICERDTCEKLERGTLLIGADNYAFGLLREEGILTSITARLLVSVAACTSVL